MTAPNAALAYQVLDHIDAHPEQWNQGQWLAETECGTAACFAGWACLLSGEKPGSDDLLGMTLASGTSIPDRAEQLLGANRFVGTYTDGYQEEEDLFHEYNTREDLGRLVEEIFGPRPEPVVEMTPPPCADHQVSWLTCDVCTAQRRVFYAALGRGDAQ